MRPGRLQQGGYTLIEVLVAFVILAMTLTILFRIFSAGMRNIGVASQYSEAVLIAEAQLDSPGFGEPLVPGRTEGVTDQRYRWTRTVTGLQSDAIDPVPGAFQISVSVEWPTLTGSRRIELSTVRLESSALDAEGRFQ